MLIRLSASISQICAGSEHSVVTVARGGVALLGVGAIGRVELCAGRGSSDGGKEGRRPHGEGDKG